MSFYKFPAMADAAAEVYENAVKHGWWDKGDRDPAEVLANIHSEISEAWECCRNGEMETVIDENTGKPEGFFVELADVVIRILDYCGGMGVDIGEVMSLKHDYNKGRPYRHGNKKY